MENQEQIKSVMSIKDWVITLIITAIPLVGFIMLFVWGFGSGTNENKANFAKGGFDRLCYYDWYIYAVYVGIWSSSIGRNGKLLISNK